MDKAAGRPKRDPSGPVKGLGTVLDNKEPTLYPDTVAESARPRNKDSGDGVSAMKADQTRRERRATTRRLLRTARRL